MSCTRSNSAFANKIKKRLREKINADLPAAYPRAFTWAVYSAEGMLVVRRTSDESAKKQDSSDGATVSAANVGTALTRLLEAAMGFANTVTSGSDAPADIVHVAGSKFLFTAARFGSGFVLTFFSSLTDGKPTTSAPTQQGSKSSPSASGAKSEGSSGEEGKESAPKEGSSARAMTHMIDDEDFAQSAFGGDELLRKLLTELNYIITDVHVPPPASSSTARRVSTDESSPNLAANTQPSASSQSTAHKTQGH